MIEIVIRGKPVAWARAGKLGKFSFTPKKQKEAAFLIGYEARSVMSNRPLLRGPLRLQLVFTYEWPKATSKKRRTGYDFGGNYKDSRPDIDNLVKLVCDSLNTIVWTDDAQVACVIAHKVYGPIPSISVLVSEMAESVTSSSLHVELPNLA